jgi:hypothetical protein
MAAFPLLEQMRADRERREAAVVAPIRRELAACRARADALKGELDALRKFVANEVSKYALEEFGERISAEMRKIVLPYARDHIPERMSVRASVQPMGNAVVVEIAMPSIRLGRVVSTVR